MTAVDQVSGPVLFARYAFPPNQLGYCGPDDAAGFFTSGVSGDDQGLRRMARDFDGARPHLQLIADASAGPIRSIPRSSRPTGWVRPRWTGSVQRRSTRRSRRMLRGRCGPMFDTVSERAPGRRGAASQLHRAVRLSVGRHARRRAAPDPGHDRPRPLPDPLGPGAQRQRRPGDRRVATAGLGRRPAPPRSAGRRDRTPGYRRPRAVGADRRRATGWRCTGTGSAT